MDQQQRELRRAAAKAFMDSLDKLQATLSDSEEAAEVEAVVEADPSLSTELNPEMMDRWEQAVADIERFMQEKNEESA